MGIFNFLFWFGGIIFSGGFLIHFILTKNDEIISSGRNGLLLVAIACLIPFINIGVGIAFAYMKLEDWLTDSPFRRRK